MCSRRVQGAMSADGLRSLSEAPSLLAIQPSKGPVVAGGSSARATASGVSVARVKYCSHCARLASLPTLARPTPPQNDDFPVGAIVSLTTKHPSLKVRRRSAPTAAHLAAAVHLSPRAHHDDPPPLLPHRATPASSGALAQTRTAIATHRCSPAQRALPARPPRRHARRPPPPGPRCARPLPSTAWTPTTWAPALPPAPRSPASAGPRPRWQRA
jgi:hypothetical protein